MTKSYCDAGAESHSAAGEVAMWAMANHLHWGLSLPENFTRRLFSPCAKALSLTMESILRKQKGNRIHFVCVCVCVSLHTLGQDVLKITN
jgi:hypothetical protein